MSNTSSQVTVTVAPPVCNTDTGSCEIKPQYVYESHIHPHNVLATLNEQRKQGLLCDMTVIVEGIELSVHKSVLAACSKYFNNIITDPANVSHNIVLELSSVSRIGMETLLEFAYTSKLTLCKENIECVLSAARELEIQNLEYSCLNLLKQKLLQEASGSSQPTCSDSTNECRNSTISRKVAHTEERDEDPSCNVSDCCMKTTTISNLAFNNSETCEKSISKGSCPLMAQLSLNPKSVSCPDDEKFSSVPDQCAKKNVCQSSYAIPANNCVTNSDQHQQKLLNFIMQQHVSQSPDTRVCRKLQPMCPSNFSQTPHGLKKETPSADFKPVCSIPCVPGPGISSCNSDTDEAFSADDEIDRNYKCSMATASCSKLRKHTDVVLPFSIEEITQLPRSELQELFNKHPNLSMQQISVMHEIRRRGKNRIAAQRCRKRKMNCIRGLQRQLENLHKEHNELMTERKCVRKNAAKLADMFQQRYKQVFSDAYTNNNDVRNSSKKIEGSNEHIVASMSEYFQKETKQVCELANRLCKAPCDNLPPYNWFCPSSEIVVVCDEDDNDTGFFKSCNSSVCSNTSYSSELADNSDSWDKCTMQHVTHDDFTVRQSVKCAPDKNIESKRPEELPVTCNRNDSIDCEKMETDISKNSEVKSYTCR